MNEEMIEKVARAIGEAERTSCGGYPSTIDSDPKWNPWLTDKHRMFARAAIAAYNLNERLREALEGDETGWLIEEQAGGYIHWIALCFEEVRRDDWCTVRHGDAPLIFVKDSNAALRFARKQDAEAFVKVFRRFMLNPTVTEHCWPALAITRDIRKALK